jgi:hypothetical protein
LITGDYFKANSDFFIASNKADKIITWLRKRTAILGLIRDKSCELTGGKSITIIRPVPTRWTSHYLAYSRLLSLKLTLTVVIEIDKAKEASC